MRSKMQTTLNVLITTIFIFISSCLPQTINTTSPVKNITSQLSKEDLEFIQKVKNKKPFNGSINISIDTALTDKIDGNKNSLGKVYTVKSNFTTQAIPSGSPVYQETFTKASKNYSIRKNFTIQDPDKYYILYVQNGNGDNKSKVSSGSIIINASEILSSNDFNESTSEIQKDSLLLYANNYINVSINDNIGSTLTVKIFEGGKPGTVIRKDDGLSEHPTAKEHQNDFILFDPSNPAILGNLNPSDGDSVNIDGRTKVSSLLLNEDESLKFEPGVMAINFKDSSGLATFQSLYDATVEFEMDGFYKLKVNTGKSPVNNIDSLVRRFSQGLPNDINSVEFSSITAFKTFAIY